MKGIKKLISLSSIFIMILTGCSNATIEGVEKEVTDTIAHVTNSDNKYVLMVKNEYRTDNPEVSYDQAFSAFFGAPKWKYFESEDGQDVVEFTGDCVYQDTSVKARIQFLVDEQAGTFEATYLAFNEVPQNMLLLTGLIEKAFEEVEVSNEVVENNSPVSEQVIKEDTTNTEIEALKTESKYYKNLAESLNEDYQATKSEREYYKNLADEATNISRSSTQDNSTSSDYLYGYINAKGEDIVGFNTEYVYNQGAATRKYPVQDGWHITAKNSTYSKGIQWYECWDTDDGDYYGWIDEEFLSFYSSGIESQVPSWDVYAAGLYGANGLSFSVNMYTSFDEDNPNEVGVIYTNDYVDDAGYMMKTGNNIYYIVGGTLNGSRIGITDTEMIVTEGDVNGTYPKIRTYPAP